MEALMTILIPALIMIESSGNPSAIGDSDLARGMLQIHAGCWQDGIEALGVDWDYKTGSMDPAKSKAVCRAYLKRYCTEKRLGHKPTLEDMARCWNGGPNGYKNKKTLTYWAKVKKELKKGR